MSDESKPNNDKPNQNRPNRSKNKRRKPQSGGGQKKQGQKRKPRKQEPLTPLGILSKQFVACGRCSFFWSGYWALIGKARMDEVAEMQSDGWLTLPFEAAVPILLERAYGCDIYSDVVRFEGTCKQCMRAFEYSVAAPLPIPIINEDGSISTEPQDGDAQTQLPTLRVQINPRTRYSPVLELTDEASADDAPQTE